MIISAMEKAKCHHVLSFKSLALLLFSLVQIFGVTGMVNDKKIDPSSILKTIVSGVEIIDCVDIYKQPAFNHPLLKNHTIQLKPSSHPTGSKSKVPNNSTNHIQMWHRNEEYCPKGTVAILRSSRTDIPPKNTYERKAFNTAADAKIPTGFHSEYVTASLPGREHYGINADINIWDPQVEPNEVSLAQLSVTDGGGDNIESIDAGWMVTTANPNATMFTYWTSDGYKKTGCYDMECFGFVQTSAHVVLGAQLEHSSTYGDKQYDFNIRIHRDIKTGNWWLTVTGIEVGYWPGELFTNLKGSAALLEWGGQVVSSKPDTTTQMGSGHFPNEGYGKAAWFRNLEFVDGNGFFNPSGDVEGHASRPECYDIQVKPSRQGFGYYFLYGGPGKK